MRGRGQDQLHLAGHPRAEPGRHPPPERQPLGASPRKPSALDPCPEHAHHRHERGAYGRQGRVEMQPELLRQPVGQHTLALPGGM